MWVFTETACIWLHLEEMPCVEHVATGGLAGGLLKARLLATTQQVDS